MKSELKWSAAHLGNVTVMYLDYALDVDTHFKLKCKTGPTSVFSEHMWLKSGVYLEWRLKAEGKIM